MGPTQSLLLLGATPTDRSDNMWVYPRVIVSTSSKVGYARHDVKYGKMNSFESSLSQCRQCRYRAFVSMPTAGHDK